MFSDVFLTVNYCVTTEDCCVMRKLLFSAWLPNLITLVCVWIPVFISEMGRTVVGGWGVGARGGGWLSIRAAYKHYTHD